MRKSIALLLGFVLLSLAVVPASLIVSADDPEHMISGTAKDLGGVTMANVEVRAERYGNATIYRAITGNQGTYNLSLPDGQYNITATISSHGSNVTYLNLPVASDIEGVDFTIQVVTGRVEGHVTAKDVPVVGAQVVLSNGNTTYLGETTMPLGSYSIVGVVPGVFVARAEKVGYWTNVSQQPVYVNENEVTDLSFILEPQPARVFGEVTVNGKPEEGVTAKLMSGTVEVKVSVTDANGNYSFSNVIAGEYQVVFSKEGLVEKTYPISISPFEAKELSISMSLEQSSTNSGFIDGLDLTHSMMVVALIVVVLLMLFALFIKVRAMRRPELLAKEDEEKEKPSSPQAKQK
ncbi:MAG: carboxypeptidase regulatory-like domain-containing protein [Methanomassiliicoccales archaeon]|nr:carboxypeptidase regulatory-like domain-containing protein [Methanomassiliicoccales archaeon]MDD1756909.1 carboxypeptidase regulatory-like domain-containing protein [Methanomassiliicoccales archaeon]